MVEPLGSGSAERLGAPVSSRSVEQTGPAVRVYHAVQEEGVALREIAETLGKGLKLPVVVDRSGESCRALWVVCATRGIGCAGVERVDARNAGLGADWTGLDRGSNEREICLTSLHVRGRTAAAPLTRRKTYNSKTALEGE